MKEHFRTWRVGPARALSLDRPRLMAILNVTPDSFFDGGAHFTTPSAIEAASRMHEDGAAIVDVGGESTRPGAEAVSAGEQIRRILGVIEGVRARLTPDDLLISVDTRLADVAEAALDAGADIINDTSAGRDDDRMFELAASRGCGLILMHRLKPPKGDVYSTKYEAPPDYGGDVVGVVREFLRARVAAAGRAGVRRESIVIDPGLGFGKSVDQNYQLAGRIQELGELDYPVLSAASRKSFLGAPTGASQPAERLAASVGLSVMHWLAGVRLFRVHDVYAQRQALEVAIRLGASAPAQEQ
ncbi:MAG: dihydropteroate synthase [Phycisphaerales bacterium]|nr:dihydropteroate synthase [Phycisphaerales bacterium]MCI0631196.1 dihydropteroate synthase [Phycisphaerales bacterium]MCI0676421.1 dihydropteroate synthase [Phycisphaerales bacterium]